MVRFDLHCPIVLTSSLCHNLYRKEDLRQLLRKAGGEGKPTVFLFSDSQLKDKSDTFLEDVNSLLNSAEVPGLWGAEELAEVLELVRPHAKRTKRAVDGTPEQLFALFTGILAVTLPCHEAHF